MTNSVIKLYILISFFLCIVLKNVQGQSLQTKADKEYYNFNYSMALNNYMRVIEKKGANKDLVVKIADCCRKMNNSKEAEKWYGQLLYKYPDAEPIYILYYAEALKSNGDYQEARNQYIKYSKLVPENKKKALSLAKDCEKAMEWMANPVQVKIENVKSLNTEFSEFSPSIIHDRFIFTTDRKFSDVDYSDRRIYGWTGMPFLSLVSANLDSNNQILFDDKVEGLNNLYHNGPATFTKNGDTIYFTRTNKVRHPKRLSAKDSGSYFINRLEIYSAVVKKGIWTNIKPFLYNDVTKYSVGHPSLSPDGNTLVFVSDMEGALGETDIFYSIKQKDGTWGKPQNAGYEVNSSEKEVFPYVGKDGTLYFASNGHAGLGGLDMFSSQLKNGQWKTPENLKYPVNSSKDDFGLVYDSTGKSGFFSSNRDGGVGGDDIYHFSNPACVLSGITLHILNKKERPLEDVLVRVYKKGDTTNVIAYERTNDMQSKKVCLRSYEPCAIIHDAAGKFHFKLQQGETYEIKATKQGYFTHLVTLEANCESSDTINLAIELRKIEINKPIVLKDLFYSDDDKLFVKRNIYYDLDKADIRYDAALELDKLVELLKENPNIKIELSSHTDSRHNHDYNMSLSQRRADAAVKYIVSKGIQKDMIIARGYGETRLINSCENNQACSEDEHQLNRRTEIKVTDVIEPDTHKVGPYDTLESISIFYNIPIDILKKLNNLEEDNLHNGQILKLK